MAMSTQHENDISIGQDEWILFVDIGDQRTNAIDIDPFIAPMGCFWMRFETECVAECCGIAAFRFWPEDIHRASAGSDVPSLVQNVAALRCFVQESESEAFVSTRLNHYFHRTAITQLLDHIARNIECTKGV
jgi:hypothetical protein